MFYKGHIRLSFQYCIWVACSRFWCFNFCTTRSGFNLYVYLQLKWNTFNKFNFFSPCCCCLEWVQLNWVNLTPLVGCWSPSVPLELVFCFGPWCWILKKVIIFCCKNQRINNNGLCEIIYFCIKEVHIVFNYSILYVYCAQQ